MDIVTEGNYQSKQCIIVDDTDSFIRLADIKECHELPTVKHRAFSLFIFNQDKLLLQQRASTKYTFPLAWTNSVCSHPRDIGQSIEYWICQRTKEELNIDIDPLALKFVTKIDYHSVSDLKYGENEIDYIYYTCLHDYTDNVDFNKDEVESIRFIDETCLEQMMENDLSLLTPWFRAIYNLVKQPKRSLLDCFQMMDSTRIYKLDNVGKAVATNDLVLRLPMAYYLAMPSKGIRSLLCQALAKYYKKDHTQIENIVDRIHNASLLHDDIEDGSIARRGMPCAHLMYGTALTLNCGTFELLEAVSDAYKLSPEIGNRVLETIKQLHRGQCADIYWTQHKIVPTTEEYLDMISYKTGALFTLIASLLCDDNSVKNDIGVLGIYFQIRDDYCNLCDEQYWIKKGFCEDFDEAKYGFPVLKYIDSGNASEWFIHERHNDKLRAFEEIHTFLGKVLETLEELETRLSTSSFPGIPKLLQKIPLPCVPSIETARNFYKS